MSDDPIIREIHETRAKLLAEHEGDLDKLMDELSAKESDYGDRVVQNREELEHLWIPLAS